MSNVTIEAARLMDMLPTDEQNFAYEFIKRLVLAWDPDYTKLTDDESRRLDAAEKSGFVNDADIDWANIGC